MNESKRRQQFSDWVEKHKGLLFKVVRAYSKTQHDSEDLYQEILLRLWNSIPNYKGNCAETTWIYRVAFFSASSWAQKEKNQREKQVQHAEEIRLTHASTLPTTENKQLDWLYDQISQLNDMDRSLTLLLLDGFKYKEMADIIGISESNVGVRINRIKSLITKKLEEEKENGIR